MITTTLSRIRARGPCESDWKRLLAGLGKTAKDDEPLPFARIVEISGIEATLFFCGAEPQYSREWRSFAVWCGSQIRRMIRAPQCLAALDVAECHMKGAASDEELFSAHRAALKVATGPEWVSVAASEREAAWAAFQASLEALVAIIAKAPKGTVASELRAARETQKKKFLEIVG